MTSELKSNVKLKIKPPIGPVGIILIIFAVAVVAGIIIFVITSTKPCGSGKVSTNIKLEDGSTLKVCAPICPKGQKVFQIKGSPPGTITGCQHCPENEKFVLLNPDEQESSTNPGKCMKICPKGTKRCPDFVNFGKIKDETNSNLDYSILNKFNHDNYDDGTNNVLCIPDNGEDVCVFNIENDNNKVKYNYTGICNNISGTPCHEYKNLSKLGIYNSCCGVGNNQSKLICESSEQTGKPFGECIGCPTGKVVCFDKEKNNEVCCDKDNCLKDNIGDSVCCPPSEQRIINSSPTEETKICCKEESWLEEYTSPSGETFPGYCCDSLHPIADNNDHTCKQKCGNVECVGFSQLGDKDPSICFENDGKDTCISPQCHAHTSNVSPPSTIENMSLFNWSGDCVELTDFVAIPEYTHKDDQGILKDTYPMCAYYSNSKNELDGSKPYIFCGGTGNESIISNYARELTFRISPSETLINQANLQDDVFTRNELAESMCKHLGLNTQAGKFGGIIDYTPIKNSDGSLSGSGNCKVIIPCGHEPISKGNNEQIESIITSEAQPCKANNMYNELNDYANNNQVSWAYNNNIKLPPHFSNQESNERTNKFLENYSFMRFRK